MVIQKGLTLKGCVEKMTLSLVPAIRPLKVCPSVEVMYTYCRDLIGLEETAWGINRFDPCRFVIAPERSGEQLHRSGLSESAI
jgi:hypothetical protein